MSPRSSSATEEAPLRHFPLYPALPRGRHRPFPRFENRGRPFPTGSPSAPRPMGCRFRGPLLGEIVSPRLIGSLCSGIPPASALPPMPLGGRRGLATRPSRHLDRPYGDGRHHRRPEPFETGLPEPFFAFFPFEGVDGRRSRPPPRLPFPGPWDPGNSEEAMTARRRDRSPCSNGAEGPPSGPPSRSYLHA